MGLFRTNKIKSQKIVRGDDIEYLIDYFKLKDSNDFLGNLIMDLTGGNRCLTMIDTDILHDKINLDPEKKSFALKTDLELNHICYLEVKTKKDVSEKVFGIRIQKAEKVNSYQIGMIISPDRMTKVKEIIKDCNAFYYVIENDKATEEILNQFNEVRGDYEELNKLFNLSFYIDYYFHRIRICCNQGTSQFVEDKLQKYL